MRRCVALLLSGGTGSRLGAEIPKQYIRTGGRMMITRSLYALFQCEEIGGVQIVADTAWHEAIRKDWAQFCLELSDTERGSVEADGPGGDKTWLAGFSAPGENRQLSI